MNRPIGVTVIAILVALNGIAAFIGGIGDILAGSEMLFAGIVALVFGLALLYLAWGLWTLQSWSWITTLIVEGINGLFALVAVFVAPGTIGAWISVAIAVVVIIYLTRPAVRSAFGERTTLT